MSVSLGVTAHNQERYFGWSIIYASLYKNYDKIVDSAQNMKNTWSEKLQEETRTILTEESFIPSDEFLHMKNINGSFGKIHIADLLAKKLFIRDKETNFNSFYMCVDELIASGWVVD